MSKKISSERLLPILGIALLAFVLAPQAADAQGVLFVKSNQVSIGTDTPTSTLDVFSSDGSARIKVRDSSAVVGNKTMLELQATTGDPKLLFRSNSGASIWSLSPAFGSFVYNEINSPNTEFQIFPNGNATLEGTLTQNSHSVFKQDFEMVEPGQILDAVVSLPVKEWSYIESPGERHVGPMAEDFWAAFGLGVDDKHLAPSDAAGVALAAIQGLHDEVLKRDQRIAELEREIVEIRALVSHMK